ncbi:MAG: hypothetical protein ACRDXX_03340 [Stackebrandtia sp.]
MKASEVTVSLNIPFVGRLEGVWVPDQAERDASWELYSELVTRIAVVPLPAGEGRLRAAMNSLYSLFGLTREILKKYGPGVAAPVPGRLNFAQVSLAMLNGLRRTTARWHPELDAHESIRPQEVDELTHERNWEHAAALRAEIDRAREMLTDFARLLNQVADVSSLLPQDLPLQQPPKTDGGGCRRNPLKATTRCPGNTDRKARPLLHSRRVCRGSPGVVAGFHTGGDVADALADAGELPRRWTPAAL